MIMRLGIALTIAGCCSAIATPAWAKRAETKISVADAVTRCPALAGQRVPASAFGLRTGGAVVNEAALIHQRGIVGAYCRLKGEIAAADKGDPSILFQVNLPSDWNRKTVEYGGGGSNGFVVKGTGYFAGGGKDVLPALSRGYVTYGSDSGHQGPGLQFVTNATAFENYSYAAVKRSKDLTTALVQAYYGRPALRNYHIGGSKGGQEAVQAVQRYYADFDGAVSYFPAAQNQSLSIAWNRMAYYAFDIPGAALDAQKQAFLKQSVMKACDALDGASDGIVSNVRGCRAGFDVRSLLCIDGKAKESCLTEPQVVALEVSNRPFVFAYPMPNEVTSVGPFPALLGADTKFWFGDGTRAGVSGFYTPAPVFPWALDNSKVDLETWNKEVLASARIFDASSPDFDGLRKRGGKLILIQGTLDMLVPNAMTDHYFESIKSRYGASTKKFARYYVAPGYGHGDGAFRMEWDALDALDRWVETGRAPVKPVAMDRGKERPGRTRPLCEYPTWPKYVGKGSLDDASSFSCVSN
jgi:feruloyl esterase